MLYNAEKEILVLDLCNQGKNIRQIAKEVRISFRDINTVLKKAAANLESENSKKQHDESINSKVTEIVDKATQAYNYSQKKRSLSRLL
jgi:transcriptional regulator